MSLFDGVVGKRQRCLSQRALRKDLHELENVSEECAVSPTNESHTDRAGEIRRLPKLHEGDSALDKLDKVLRKHNLLLTGQGIDSLHAVRQVRLA